MFAGLRSSDVILEDLRVSPKAQHCVGKMQKGKAVVGVRRLKDSAVPWGLLASGMGSEVSVINFLLNLRCYWLRGIELTSAPAV